MAAASVGVVSIPALDGGDREVMAELSDVGRPVVINAIAEANASKSVNDGCHVAKEMSPVENTSTSKELRSDEVEDMRKDDLERGSIQTRSKSRPLTSFADAMKLPYNQDCLRPLFGPGMSQRAWDSGKFNIERHCIDPWMKKNWRRCRNLCKGGRAGGVKFNQLRRNFMRMLWFEKKGIPIDWKTVNVSSPRLVSEHRGKNEPVESKTVEPRRSQRVERRKKRQRCLSPASKVPPASPPAQVAPKRQGNEHQASAVVFVSKEDENRMASLALGPKRQENDHQASAVVSVSKEDENRMASLAVAPKRQENDHQASAVVSVPKVDENKMTSLAGMRALQEAGLVIIKQEDFLKMQSDSCRDHEEIMRLRVGLETENCLRIATESRRQDDFARMHSEGCHNRDEMHRLKMELESLKRQVIAAEASRTELLLDQASGNQQRRDLSSSALSCSICQKDLTVLPMMSPGCCKCRFHIHCLWKRIASNRMCSCGKLYPDLLYTYLGRLPQIGTRPGPGVSESLAVQQQERDAATDDGRAVEVQKVKIVVRELLREWHVAGGRNGWHLHNLSDSMRVRFDAFHADLQKRAQALGGQKAREVFLSYANKFGLSTGNFTMVYPGLDLPEEPVYSHGTGGCNFSDESETHARGPSPVSEDGDDEHRRKMEMIIRATSSPSDHEARSEIEDSPVGHSKRRRK